MRPLPTTPSSDLSPATFAFTATRIAVSQIIKSLGFNSAHRSALDTLTDTATKYLSAVAASASGSSRTQSNLHDIILALESLGSVQGFVGASNLNRPILASSTLTDLSRFVDYALEIPFAQAVRWHHSVPPRGISGQLTGDGHGQNGHVPRWLPVFPDIEREREVVKREVLYGFVGSEETMDLKGEDLVLVDEKMKKTRVQLPRKRERVRFKIGVRDRVLGVDSRNVVCKGGKRFFCENNAKDADDNRDKKMKMTMTKCNGNLNGSGEGIIGNSVQPLRYYRRRNRL